MAARRGGLSNASFTLRLSLRGALGVHLIKIPWNSGNYSRSWHCALVVVRAAATAITHAEASMAARRGGLSKASFTHLLLHPATAALGMRHRGTAAHGAALRRAVALAGKLRGCWASQRGLSKRLEANTHHHTTYQQAKMIEFSSTVDKEFFEIGQIPQIIFLPLIA